MRLLLDTHVILWWLFGSPGFGERSWQLLNSATTKYCSAASAWEMALKKFKG